ncbi:threonine/serine dehydratase [Fuerstiella marisgermanici]|uniref:L-threonine dehydratase catabolic TdcB n=1 Tax=Fuerstiella marisgermanici TaxID=1891926 RepID=A0A1P8WSG0_9PLAN|nr:threonine/serine dehydratase [Fuerstiella marisgermanici]APZ96995.1 L-threonine dehydratase catabolic TdcB [Fuerstiella marisgermanici]
MNKYAPPAFQLSARHLESVREAAGRIQGMVQRTPCFLNERLSQQLGCSLYVKAENLQPCGAFKVRGATNAVFAAAPDVIARGVLTHSSGNHAAAIARAASLRGVPAYIVMPENSAAGKIANVRAYGVEPVFCAPTADARQAKADELLAETGAYFIHPYNQADVIAGQGTMGLEILEQVPDVDLIVVPVGGGGMMSGILLAIKSLRPEVQVIGAEPEFADDAYRSLQSGRIEPPNRYDTIADGLRTPLGELTFPIIQSLMDDLTLVSEQAIVEATEELSYAAKLVLEPSGGVAYAAARKIASRHAGKNVVVIACGGNV